MTPYVEFADGLKVGLETCWPEVTQEAIELPMSVRDDWQSKRFAPGLWRCSVHAKSLPEPISFDIVERLQRTGQQCKVIFPCDDNGGRFQVNVIAKSVSCEQIFESNDFKVVTIFDFEGHDPSGVFYTDDDVQPDLVVNQ